MKDKQPKSYDIREATGGVKWQIILYDKWVEKEKIRRAEARKKKEEKCECVIL